jgi:hypothetical protein
MCRTRFLKKSLGRLTVDLQGVDLGTKTLYCLGCGVVEPFCSNLTAEFSEQIDVFNDVHSLCPQHPKQVQTSGPQCTKCGAFTTYKRVESHGLCMKCEHESKVTNVG